VGVIIAGLQHDRTAKTTTVNSKRPTIVVAPLAPAPSGGPGATASGSGGCAEIALVVAAGL
jgi:hypothetical protein